MLEHLDVCVIICFMRYLQLFVIPFVLSLVFTPLVRILALKNGFVSYPRADRWHKHPTFIRLGD